MLENFGTDVTNGGGPVTKRQLSGEQEDDGNAGQLEEPLPAAPQKKKKKKDNSKKKKRRGLKKTAADEAEESEGEEKEEEPGAPDFDEILENLVQTDGGCDSRTEGEEERSSREEETGSPLWSSLSRILQCDGGEDSDSETDLGMLTGISDPKFIIENIFFFQYCHILYRNIRTMIARLNYI
jgi:hypothetical protein